MEKISINIIQSSSKGNSIVLFDGKTNLILDFGIEHRVWQNSKIWLKMNNDNISGILLSHYHADHTKTIKYIKNIEKLSFYSSQQTFNYIKNNFNTLIDNKFILNNSINKWVKIGISNWKIKPIWTIHNAEGSLSFIIKNKKTKIVYITDTKFFIDKHFKNCTAYIIESPYGLEYDSNNKVKLAVNLYNETWHLKLTETEQLFYEYVTKKTKLFIFSHLNPTINDFTIIDNLTSKLSSKKTKVHYIQPNLLNKQKYYI